MPRWNMNERMRKYELKYSIKGKNQSMYDNIFKNKFDFFFFIILLSRFLEKKKFSLGIEYEK